MACPCRLTFSLPSPETKLAQLRQILADYTHLPPQSFKLIHAGAVMKDDNAPSESYFIIPYVLLGSIDRIHTHTARLNVVTAAKIKMASLVT